MPVAASVLLAETPREAIDALTVHDKVSSVATHTVEAADIAQLRAVEAGQREREALAAADDAAERVDALKAQAKAKRAEAEAKYQAYRDYLAVPGPQATIGPDGCPISVPEGTLREGSDLIGASQLCAKSVAEAATPQAALAIKFAFSKLGAPYACGGVGRMEPFRFDCSSLVSRAYWDGAGIPVAGDTWAPSTRNMMPWDGVSLDPHYAEVPVDQIRPGDLLLYRSCTEEPCSYQHVVMALADGYMLHTNSCGDVAHVELIPGLTPEANFVVARRVVLLEGEKVSPRVDIIPDLPVYPEPETFTNDPAMQPSAAPATDEAAQPDWESPAVENQRDSRR